MQSTYVCLSQELGFLSSSVNVALSLSLSLSRYIIERSSDQQLESSYSEGKTKQRRSRNNQLLDTNLLLPSTLTEGVDLYTAWYLLTTIIFIDSVELSRKL